MEILLLKDGKVLLEDGKISKATVVCQNGKIIDIINSIDSKYSDFENCTTVNCKGQYVFPGFIDVHVHGGDGADSNHATEEAYQIISKAQVKHGTTSIVMAISGGFSDDNILQCSEALLSVQGETCGANILGFHLEGPFVSVKKRGAISPLNLCDPSVEKAKHFLGKHSDLFKIITLAPELFNSMEIIDYLKSLGIIVALGHSEANYQTTIQAIEHGASHFTHVWNAMTPPAPRDPGMLIPALAYDNCYLEIIADGYHVHKDNVIFTLRTKPLSKICLMTDGIEVTGTDVTEFFYEGVGKIEVHDGRTWGPGGAIMGSILTQDKAVRNVVSWTGLELPKVIDMVTKNPAQELNLYPQKGCIRKGSDADITILDNDLNICYTIVDGEIKYQK